MEPIIKKLTSRKFLMAVLVIVTIFLNAIGITGLETGELFTLSATVSAWIFGESVLDRERIKASQLNAIQNAEAQYNDVVAQATQLIQEKDDLIGALKEMLPTDPSDVSDKAWLEDANGEIHANE